MRAHALFTDTAISLILGKVDDNELILLKVTDLLKAK